MERSEFVDYLLYAHGQKAITDFMLIRVLRRLHRYYETGLAPPPQPCVIHLPYQPAGVRLALV